MTTRTQILRSSTPGQTPAAGSRLPGELWTTFPDLQLGVIDGSKNPQKLIAVRFFSASANYAIGDFVIQAGALYVANSAVTAGAFNASKWNKIVIAGDLSTLPYLPIAGGTLTGALTLAADPGAALGAATKQYVDTKAGAYLPLAGGTLTGALTLAADPAANLQPATKQYVDGGRLGDNRIINGDMRIDQRNNGASGTAVSYTIDRWQYSASQTSKLSWVRSSGSTTFGAAYWLYFQSSSAYTPLTTDYFGALQIIEADMVSDFMWGTANAQPATLSFWMFSSLAGTFGGSIRNAANTRSYPFSWSAPAASTWTRVIVTIPGDTAGTWVMSGNAGALSVAFDLGSGATFRGPANAWAGANYVGATGSVNVIGTNAAQFAVTAVKLEIGAVATPFNRQSLAKSMADCQRYYQRLQPTLIGYAVAASSVAIAGFYLATPRATPTINIITNACSNVGTPTFSSTPTGMAMSGTVAATGGFTLNAVLEASAEL